MTPSEPATNDPVRSNDVSGDDEDVLWRKFGAATSVEGFCSTWLALQCRKIRGVAAGMLVLGSPEQDRAFAPVAFWPGKDPDLKRLAEVAERALKERRGVVIPRRREGDGSSQTRYDIAYPIQVSGQLYGVVALDADSRPQEAVRDIMRQLRWGSAWMEVLVHRRQAATDAAPQKRLQAVVGVLPTVVSQPAFNGAAVALVTELATRFQCDRVSLGFVKRGSVQVEALSHSAQFARDTNLVRAIGNAMDEAIDQQTSVVFPAPEQRTLVTRGHADLARQGGNDAICSVPLSGQHESVGVITFERAAGQPFDEETVQVFESICALVGPILEVNRRDDRWLARKAIDAIQAQLGALIGPRHVALKLTVLGIVIVLSFSCLATGTYRVSARTVIEPATKQAVVAAFNGYVTEAPLKAGDLVKKNDILARLEDRELKLERSKWQSQQEQSERQYYEALGNRNAPQVQISTAQIAQAKAEVALLDDQISRTEVTAPIDGMIVTGDLSQSLGAPIERGQVMFELAPLESYRIVMQVDERQIGEVDVGQHGRLVLTGFAGNPIDFSVGRITPVSTANEGRNFFRVEATLENVPERLRPGMEGVGKIEIGRRRLIWIWSHEVIDWIRLKTWNWLP
jgi:RND family efflux transporter MFP subunit